MPLVLWLVATFGLVCAVTRSRAAAHPIPLPKPKPRAVREHVVVPSIHSREVACAQRSGVRHGEDALRVLDLGDDSPPRLGIMADSNCCLSVFQGRRIAWHQL
jgi:hypothetical protein